jgi:hypothetical protein
LLKLELSSSAFIILRQEDLEAPDSNIAFTGSDNAFTIGCSDLYFVAFCDSDCTAKFVAQIINDQTPYSWRHEGEHLIEKKEGDQDQEYPKR